MELTGGQLECVEIAAKIMARRTGQPHLYDEFYQVAAEAVIEAIPRYDPSKGTSARTWLTNAAKYRILDYIRTEMGRKPGSMRTNESPHSPINDPDEGYWSPFEKAELETGYDEVDDEDEEARVIRWALEVLAEELTTTQLVAVQAWLRCGRLKKAGEMIGKSEGWVCRCVLAAEEVLNARRTEVVGP